MTREAAEVLAIQAFGFLAADPELAAQFMQSTGLQPEDIRTRAGSGDFQGAVLDYLLGNESLLLVFCEHACVDPAIIAPARHVLAGPGEPAG